MSAVLCLGKIIQTVLNSRITVEIKRVHALIKKKHIITVKQINSCNVSNATSYRKRYRYTHLFIIVNNILVTYVCIDFKQTC